MSPTVQHTGDFRWMSKLKSCKCEAWDDMPSFTGDWSYCPWCGKELRVEVPRLLEINIGGAMSDGGIHANYDITFEFSSMDYDFVVTLSSGSTLGDVIGELKQLIVNLEAEADKH